MSTRRTKALSIGTALRGVLGAKGSASATVSKALSTPSEHQGKPQLVHTEERIVQLLKVHAIACINLEAELRIYSNAIVKLNKEAPLEENGQ